MTDPVYDVIGEGYARRRREPAPKAAAGLTVDPAFKLAAFYFSSSTPVLG